MTDSRVDQLGDDLYVIDAYMDGRPDRLSCYLFDTPERLLIEVGPSVTLHHLVAALEELGIDDLARIVVTHIHLDHAGGVGHLAARFPDARIGVHEAGARHLVSPDRLWNSTARIYGDQELERMWGRMEPVSEDRLEVLSEGARIPLGGRRSIEVLYTPGHAKHHVVYHDQRTGGMFVGDAVGLCYPHGHFVMPNTPPPDFDPEEAARQMHRMAAREPAFLGFAHFGPAHEVAQALADAEQRMWSWVRVVASFEALDDHTATERLRRWALDDYLALGYSPMDVEQYDEAVHWPMHVTGIRRWLSQRTP